MPLTEDAILAAAVYRVKRCVLDEVEQLILNRDCGPVYEPDEPGAPLSPDDFSVWWMTDEEKAEREHATRGGAQTSTTTMK